MEDKYIKNYIENAVEYIEKNLNTNLTVDTISDNIYLSKFHFQRIFKSITGKGLIEYTRSRKLTKSLEDLINTNLPIGKIALRYSYDYEQSFTRAFKSEFGVSPTDYRKEQKIVNITPKADVELLIELENAVIIKPFHVSRPSFTIGGVLNKVDNIDNEKNYKSTNVAIDFFYNHKQNIRSARDENIYYGYTYRDDTCVDSTYYLSALEIDEKTMMPDTFSKITVPPSNYTVFKFIGFFSPEKITWQHMVDIWNFKDDYLLKDKNENIKSYFHFEYINMKICSENYCELDLYVPIL